MRSIMFFQNVTSNVWGNYGFQTLFYLSLILIFVLGKKRFRQFSTLGYSFCILLILYNPITYLVCIYIFQNDNPLSYYARMFCLLPIVFVIAYAMVLVLLRTSGWKKLFGTLLMLAVIASSGHSAYGEAWFTKASNFNKVPEDVVQLCDIFQEYDAPVSIMVPTDLTAYIRQMDSKFSMPYGRYQNTEISDQLQSKTPNIRVIFDYVLQTDTEYIVALYDENSFGYYIEWNFQMVDYTNQYVVLELNPSGWISGKNNRISSNTENNNTGICGTEQISSIDASEENGPADSAKKTVVACVGDSITWGIIKDEDGNIISSANYPEALSRLFGGTKTVLNFGQPGACAVGGVPSSYENLAVYQESMESNADAFIIMLGTNDSIAAVWNEEAFQADYAKLLDSYRENFPNAVIYTMTPPAYILQKGRIPSFTVYRQRFWRNLLFHI